MTEQEFNELIQQIKNGTFIGNKIEISTTDYDGEILEESIDFNDDKAILLAETLKKIQILLNLIYVIII